MLYPPLIFKWGSLVGISLPSSGANNTSPFVSGDVVFQPKEFTSAITSDWAIVPWCNTDFAPYGDKNADHLITVHNPATGIGDVCRYMGIVEGVNWRMPTITEWQELYGSAATNGGQSVKLGDGWIAGNYYTLRGQAMGAGRNYVSITGEGAKARVNNADPNTCGVVFFPASGLREYNNGEISWIGHSGLYWASTGATATNGYCIGFNPLDVWPQRIDSRTLALSVRCIRE